MPTGMRHVVKVHPGQKVAKGRRGMFFPVTDDDPRAALTVDRTAYIENGKLTYAEKPKPPANHPATP